MTENSEDVTTETQFHYYSLESKSQHALVSVQKSDLRQACIRNDVQAVQLLLDIIDINRPLQDEWTALMFALKYAHPKLVEMLVHKGASVNYSAYKSLFTPLMALASTACEFADDINKCLLFFNAVPIHVNAVNFSKETALTIACYNSCKPVIKWLAGKGADINYRNKDGKTALDICASLGRGQVCATILEAFKNVDIGQASEEGLTAVDMAKQVGFGKIASILFQIQVSGKMSHECQESLQHLEQCNPVDQSTNVEEQSVEFRTEGSVIESQLLISGLKKYVPIFRDNKIDFEKFLLLDEHQLIELGIKEKGARFRILEYVYMANSQEWSARCLPRLHQDFASMRFSYGRKRYCVNNALDPEKYIYKNANAISYQRNTCRQMSLMNSTLMQILNQMKNFVPADGTVNNLDRVDAMKFFLLSIKALIKGIRTREAETRSILWQHPGKYKNGQYIHEDEIVDSDISATDGGATLRKLSMILFRIAAFALTPNHI